ncbi:MAG TPA: LysR family transcriptional regulator [Burkholderiaceae bacterium]|nr:LysR family transcriptional regulator [Burkholderiaceae bacterium]
MLSPALTYFREVALSGSIRRAAEHLSIAPSAISRQIGNLEAVLRANLFDRRARRLTLTTAGELLLQYSERSSADFETLRESLQQISGLQAGQVRLGSVEGMVTYFLSRYLATFNKRYPRVRVIVSVVGSRAVLELLRDGEVDLALAFGLPARNPFREHARLEQPLCVIVAAGHPLASRRSISFKALADQHVALPDRTFQIRSLIDHIATKTKTTLDRVIETNTLEMAKGVVRNSELLTFLPRYAALREIANGELCAVPLQERDLAHTSISLITMPSRQLSPAARKLLDTFKAGMTRYGASTERG